MFEKRILQIIHQINIENLQQQKTLDFFDFFKIIINNSHLLVKIAYSVLIYFLIFFSILSKILFFSKTFEIKYFKKIIIILNKIYFFRDILKFIKIYSIIYNYE